MSYIPLPTYNCDVVREPPSSGAGNADGYGSVVYIYIRGGFLRIKILRAHVILHTTLYWGYRVVRYVNVIQRDRSSPGPRTTAYHPALGIQGGTVGSYNGTAP